LSGTLGLVARAELRACFGIRRALSARSLQSLEPCGTEARGSSLMKLLAPSAARLW